MAGSDFAKVLEECRLSAIRGQAIASDERTILDGTLSRAESEIRDTVIEFQKSPCKTAGMTELLQSQLENIRSAVDDLRISFDEDLSLLASHMGSFSITLFGRTMAGKSTLMEVLTEGDGSAIGQGAQRTTRDIRQYEWNGLTVTDVPGIGAFEGEEDTRLAFDAAKTADLILFLLTDDAPQAIEADCFRQVVELGKPVIVIMNVKVSVEGGKSVKLIARDMNRAFDSERLASVRRQFLKFAEPMGQDWSNVPFVFVHLKSAFMAQQQESSEDRALWNSMSRIDELKDLLVEQVSQRGKFIRIKTFVDVIANPMLLAIDELNRQSLVNNAQSKVITDKSNAIAKRRDVFVKDSRRRIESFMMQLKSELRVDIADFVDEHYQDKHADLAWGEVIKGKKLEDRCKVLLDELEESVDEIISETIREMKSELEYVSVATIERNFLTPTIIDSQRIVQWSAFLLGDCALGAIMLIGEILEVSLGPAGWIALGITIAGTVAVMLLESRETKEVRARAKLEKEITNSVNATCDSIWTQLEQNLDKLVKNKLDRVIEEFEKVHSVISSLASSQTSLCNDLGGQLLSLNATMTREFANVTSDSFAVPSALKVARIPGVCMALVLSSEVSVDPAVIERMSSILSEEVIVVTDTGDELDLINSVLDNSSGSINLTLDKEDKTVKIKSGIQGVKKYNRIRLLRQLLPYRIEADYDNG